MPFRLLHIIPTLDRAGAEKQLVLLATHLPRDEFEVYVCALTRGGPLLAELHDAGIPTAVIGKRWKADPAAYWKLRRHVARLRPDIVHTWLFAAGAYGRRAAIAQKVPSLVHGERCVDAWKNQWQWWLDRRLAERTTRLVANSPGVRDYNVAHGLPAEKFTVIPNGVPPARASDVTRDELCAKLDLPPDARLIGTVGRLWPQKRVKDLIWALELVAVLHPTIRLLVIGDGPQRPDLERYASLASSLDRVRFLGHRDDVWRILPHLDVLWQGSGYEGVPNAVLEALAAAVPVVATDIPGNRDLVIPGETGFLVPIAGRAEYARATDRILADEALARRFGEAGREKALGSFGVQQMVAAYGRLYRETVACSITARPPTPESCGTSAR